MTAQMTWTAEEIVETLYRTLLLREPDDDGLRAHVANLLGGGAAPLAWIIRDAPTPAG